MDAVDFFDQFLDADEKRQIGMALKQAELDLQNSNGKTCGRCHWWMKSSDCPQEHNVKGMSRGPSSGDYIARSCSKFQRSSSAEKLTRELEERVVKISKAKSFSDLPPFTHY